MAQHNFKALLKKRRWTADLDRHFLDDAELVTLVFAGVLVVLFIVGLALLLVL